MQKAPEALQQALSHTASLGPPLRTGPTTEDWEAVKQIVERLYLVERRRLKDVRTSLQRTHGFRATERMFKARIHQWGFSKNVSSDEWRAVAKLYKTHKESGRQVMEFSVNGRRKTVAELQKHIKLQGFSEQDFLSAADCVVVPAHVRCCTPDPGGTPSSSSHSPVWASATNSISGSLHFTPISSHTPLPHSQVAPMAENSFPHDDSLCGISPSACMRRLSADTSHQKEQTNEQDYVLVPDPFELPSELLSPPPSCDQVHQDVRTMALQIVEPAALMSRYGADDITSWILLSSTARADKDRDFGYCCQKCNQPISKHVISLEELVPSQQEPRNLLDASDQPAMTLPVSTSSHGEAWRWIAFCFAACIAMRRGDVELSTKSLDGAAAEFEEMLSKNDCLILTGLNLMLSIMHMHDQGSIAESVVNSASEVAARLRPVDDPILLTIKWMTVVAALNLQESGRNAEVLEQLQNIHKTLEEELGAANPSSLAALYNFGWMLCFEGQLPEAEEKLRQLHAASSLTFGPAHMQSVTALTTLSRALSGQGNHDGALQTMQRAIRDSKSILGRSHPYRLESKRRLALIYRAIGERSLMEGLYWDVLRGRIKMLGPEHPYTEGARLDLVELLKELGKWKDDGSSQCSVDELYVSRTPWQSSHEAY